MMTHDLDWEQRLLEDDGLVAGLADEAAAAVKQWCLEQIRIARDGALPTVSDDFVDTLVEQVRVVTDVVDALERHGPSRWMANRLSRVVTDGERALRVLAEPRPIADRLRDVLSGLRPVRH